MIFGLPVVGSSTCNAAAIQRLCTPPLFSASLAVDNKAFHLSRGST